MSNSARNAKKNIFFLPIIAVFVGSGGIVYTKKAILIEKMAIASDLAAVGPSVPSPDSIRNIISIRGHLIAKTV